MESIKDSPEQWMEVAKRIGLSNEETEGAIEMMKFIQTFDGFNRSGDAAEYYGNEGKITFLNERFCRKLANTDDIEEFDNVHCAYETIWSDVKDKSFSEKIDFWTTKYMILGNEDEKMKTLVLCMC